MVCVYSTVNATMLVWSWNIPEWHYHFELHLGAQAQQWAEGLSLYKNNSRLQMEWCCEWQPMVCFGSTVTLWCLAFVSTFPRAVRAEVFTTTWVKCKFPMTSLLWPDELTWFLSFCWWWNWILQWKKENKWSISLCGSSVRWTWKEGSFTWNHVRHVQ